MKIAFRAVITVTFLLLGVALPAAPQGNRALVALRGEIRVEPVEGSLLGRPAALTVKGVTLAEALTLLSTTANASVAFSPNSLPGGRKVECECEGANLAEALDRILTGTEFGYVELGDQIVIVKRARPETVEFARRPPAQLASASLVLSSDIGSFLSPGAPAPVVFRAPRQEPVIVGTVLDARSGTPISGAQVIVVGTQMGALTNEAGRFRIGGLTAPSVELEVIMMGYRTVRQAARVGETDLRIVLTQAAVALDAIVVTGTAGAVQKRSIGNALGQLEAKQVLDVAPVRSVGDMISGRVAGVVVTQGTGMAGAGGRISVRGRTSVSLASDPLIYIDGVRVANDPATGPTGYDMRPISRLGDLNPNDIERIEIIKGPAAATLYGTEASNGVIQVITKRGVTSAPRVSVRTRQGVQWFNDAAERIGPAWGPDPQTGNIIAMNVVELEEAAGRDMWTPGYMQGYGASVQGGTDNVQYYLGMDYDRDNGVEPTNRLNRFSGRANIALTLHETARVNMNVGIVRSRIDIAPDRNASLMPSVMFAIPAFLNTAKRGFYIAPQEVLWDVYDNVFQTVGRITSGLQFDHRPTAWFTHRLTVGLDQTSEGNQWIIERQPDAYSAFFSATFLKGVKNITFRDVLYTTVDYSGTARYNLADGISLGTSLGMQFFRRFTEQTTARGEEFAMPDLKTVAAAAVTFGSDDFVENSTVGVFLQQEFSWKNRFFVTGAVRADDNSAFGEEFDLVYYPKLSAAWVLSEEPFWNVPTVDALRLRGAYGQSGQQPQAFAALRTYRPITGPGDQSAVSPYLVGNPELAPERGEEFEVGFEAGLLGERFGIDLTYYRQTTKDAILLRDIAPSTGFPGQQFVNAGSVRNTGIELRLDVLALDTRRADLDLTFSISTNDNEILSLGGLETIFNQYTRHQEGFPVASYFGRRVVSADRGPDGKPTNILCDGGPGAAPVACAEAPEVFWGRPTPEREGSLTAGLTLLGMLRLHGMVDFKSNVYKWDLSRWARGGVFRTAEINHFPERFDPVEAAQVQVTGGGIHAYIYDASYSKLRELSASLQLPERWAARIGASRARITIAGRNLHTWTKYPGLDPENISNLTVDYASDQAQLPQLRQFITSIDVTF
jgi:TonB-dependent SusC/RagA subfamily outer membrane receptor